MMEDSKHHAGIMAVKHEKKRHKTQFIILLVINKNNIKKWVI